MKGVSVSSNLRVARVGCGPRVWEGVGAGVRGMDPGCRLLVFVVFDFVEQSADELFLGFVFLHLCANDFLCDVEGEG